MRVKVLLVAAISVLPSMSGCFVILDHEMPAEPSTEFIARSDDFVGFQSWPSVEVGSSPAVAPHEAAVRRAYVNAMPSEEAETFPVGTMIVKTGAGGELTGEAGSEIHAMVKRGGGFNDAGARGWEWFELNVDDGDEEPILVWRGTDAPAGESYGCAPGAECGDEATCNGCHEGSIGNDFVNSRPLQLGNFDASLVAQGR